jgi:cyanophycinase-like exopeptidase
MTLGLLCIMGSGETTPTMTQTHRALIARAKAVGGGSQAVMLDTPYGFQGNADDITERTLEYFTKSVLVTPSVASLRTPTADAVTVGKVRAQIDSASWLFAGPGSPSYALRTWRATQMAGVFAERLERGAVVVMSSAAALTVGTHTVPVYEVYKVGTDPYWEEGLDLLTAFDLDAVVIPHFDNTEGGNHDTRFCYLGERRLAVMEAQLPAGRWVLGVDEHTALQLDFEADQFSVTGKGGVTVRRDGKQWVYPAGTAGEIADLRRGESRTSTAARNVVATDITDLSDATSSAATGADEALGVLETARRAADRMPTYLSEGNVDAVVADIVAVEEILEEWKGDTSTTDERERARQTLHGMVVRLGEVAVDGTRDLASVIAPIVDVALAARVAARERKDYEASDVIRNALVAAGLEVKDTPSGVQWSLTEDFGSR